MELRYHSSEESGSVWRELIEQAGGPEKWFAHLAEVHNLTTSQVKESLVLSRYDGVVGSEQINAAIEALKSPDEEGLRGTIDDMVDAACTDSSADLYEWEGERSGQFLLSLRVCKPPREGEVSLSVSLFSSSREEGVGGLEDRGSILDVRLSSKRMKKLGLTPGDVQYEEVEVVMGGRPRKRSNLMATVPNMKVKSIEVDPMFGLSCEDIRRLTQALLTVYGQQLCGGVQNEITFVSDSLFGGIGEMVRGMEMGLEPITEHGRTVIEAVGDDVHADWKIIEPPSDIDRNWYVVNKSDESNPSNPDNPKILEREQHRGGRWSSGRGTLDFLRSAVPTVGWTVCTG